MENSGNKDQSLKGYKIVIILMAVILTALAVLYYSQSNKLRTDNKELMVQKDTLANRLTELLGDYESIRTENDTINQQLEGERVKADSLLDKLKSERSISYAKLKSYEKEVGLLRSIMRGYIQTIDSLDNINKTLVSENRQFRTQVASERLRADKAEEQASELSNKVKQGGIIRARDIQLKAFNNSNREVTRAKQAARLRVDFTLTANELATAGSRTIYVRIIGPSGYLLATSNKYFQFEGESMAYSAARPDVDYQNQDLPVSIYYDGTDIDAGKFSVAVYMDGYLIGRNEIILK